MIDKKTCKIAFLILHYQNKSVTKKCVKYIQKLENIFSHEIVIVDNASPNESGKELMEQYRDISNIHVLCTQTNVGFASGNNIGYIYAREKCKADIIIAMNSDVFIYDNKFINKLILICERYNKAHIIAPDIVIKNGYHQNPYMLKPISTNDQKKIILKKRIGYVLYGLPIISKILINRKSIKEFQPNKKEKETQSISNIIPHGACVIFLPNWINQEKNAFIEGTFLFVEEELLYDYCENKQYSIIYCPELIVNHMEDASQNSINKTELEKKRRQMKYEINSRKLLINKRKFYNEQGEKYGR